MRVARILHLLSSISDYNAPVTRPYICQRTPTYGDMSDKLGARFIQVKNTSVTFFIGYPNVHIARDTVRIRSSWKTAKSSNYTSQNSSCDPGIIQREVSIITKGYNFVH